MQRMWHERNLLNLEKTEGDMTTVHKHARGCHQEEKSQPDFHVDIAKRDEVHFQNGRLIPLQYFCNFFILERG